VEFVQWRQTPGEWRQTDTGFTCDALPPVQRAILLRSRDLARATVSIARLGRVVLPAPSAPVVHTPFLARNVASWVALSTKESIDSVTVEAIAILNEWGNPLAPVRMGPDATRNFAKAIKAGIEPPETLGGLMVVSWADLGSAALRLLSGIQLQQAISMPLVRPQALRDELNRAVVWGGFNFNQPSVEGLRLAALDAMQHLAGLASGDEMIGHYRLNLTLSEGRRVWRPGPASLYGAIWIRLLELTADHLGSQQERLCANPACTATIAPRQGAGRPRMFCDKHLPNKHRYREESK